MLAQPTVKLTTPASLWRSLGAYDPNDADAAARGAAAAQWRQWITARCP